MVRELSDRREGRAKRLGKLQVFPDQLPQAATADRAFSPSAFWSVAHAARLRNGGDQLSEVEWEGQTRALTGASTRAIRRGYNTDGEQKARRNAAILRERLRATHGLHRCSVCGWSAIGAVGVCQREDGRLALASVATCGSVWGCPCCALIIKGKRAEEIKAGITAHGQHFGPESWAMMTLTIRHEQKHTMKQLQEVFQTAWNFFRTRVSTADKLARKDYRSARRDHINSLPITRSEKATLRKMGPVYRLPSVWERMGHLGNVYGAETTYGAHGWHYHRHVLLVLNARATKEGLATHREHLAEWWAECVREAMGEDFVPSVERGVKLTHGESDYLAKLGLEVSDVGAKQAKNGNLTPWGLGEMAAQGSGQALDAWIEYCEATKARKAVQISDGLMKHWKRLGWRPLPEDGVLADESRGAELIREVTNDQWRLWRQSGLVTCDLAAGIEAVDARLESYHKPEVPGWGDGDRMLDEMCDRSDAAERYAIDLEAGRRGKTNQERREEFLLELTLWKQKVDGGNNHEGYNQSADDRRSRGKSEVPRERGGTECGDERLRQARRVAFGEGVRAGADHTRQGAREKGAAYLRGGSHGDRDLEHARRGAEEREASFCVVDRDPQLELTFRQEKGRLKSVQR